jgi:hypothetical protein
MAYKYRHRATHDGTSEPLPSVFHSLKLRLSFLSLQPTSIYKDVIKFKNIIISRSDASVSGHSFDPTTLQILILILIVFISFSLRLVRTKAG